MLPREIRVPSNLASYWEREANRFLETVTLCEAFCGNIKKKFSFQSLLSYDISAYLFFCLQLLNISISLFSMLLFLCSAIFSLSFKHSEHHLLLVLYVWCIPKVPHIITALRLLSFIFQDSLDSSIADLRFLRLNKFL